jgi:cytochrome P450
MTELANLFAPEVRRDPYPTYARLRRDAPVQQVEPMGLWAVSRAQDVEYVLKNSQVFSSSGFETLFKPAWLPHNPLGDSLVTKDGPGHAKLRALLSSAFTPRAIARLEVRIREFTADLADRLSALGEMDFVAEFCSPLPGRVTAEILGIDPATHHKFRRWIGHLAMVSPMYPGDELATAIRTTVSEMEGYLKEVVTARRHKPEDDTVSDLVRAEVDGQRLTDAEIIAFLFLLLPAGYETTSHLFATMMLGFTQRPEEFSRLRTDKSLIPAYVEEALRKEPPAHGLMRLTLAEADIGGVKVPPGAMVLVLLGSANHDESRFAEPEHFDVTRGSHGGFAFSYGAHFCLGAPLARLEARVVLEELVARFRGFERLHGEVEWNFAVHVRGPAALQIRVLPT